jgi:hypothetical protein
LTALNAAFNAVKLFLVSAFTFRKKQLDRVEGSILILMMAGYMWYLIANL